jgi:hypothetical protein
MTISNKTFRDYALGLALRMLVLAMIVPVALVLFSGSIISNRAAEAKPDLPANVSLPSSPDTSNCHHMLRVVSSPNVGASDNQLAAVAAGRPLDTAPGTHGNIWAVGYYLDANAVPRTLIESWNAGAWNVVASPNVGTNRNYLNSVAVVGPSDVWAVGFYWDVNNVQRTLTEHWNGNAWSIVQSPNVGSHENYLNGVAVIGPNDVWAVGLYSPDTYGYLTLAMHWDGGLWSVVPSPNMNTRDNYLVSVSVANPHDIWAVGYYSETRADQKTLTMHWNGTAWTIVASPNVGTNRNYLNSVAVASSNNVWAVGFYWNASNVQRTLTEHWNGKVWSVVAAPDAGTNENYLNSVAVAGPHDVWAVGLYSPDMVRYSTLMLHGDGTHWAIFPSLDAGTRDNYLNGVTVSGHGEVWSVGYSRNTGEQEKTLTERYACEP